jgi:hypothetical protein
VHEIVSSVEKYNKIQPRLSLIFPLRILSFPRLTGNTRETLSLLVGKSESPYESQSAQTSGQNNRNTIVLDPFSDPLLDTTIVTMYV